LKLSGNRLLSDSSEAIYSLGFSQIALLQFRNGNDAEIKDGQRMKNLALSLSITLFTLIAIGALRTVFDTKAPFLKRWEDGTRQAYLALTIAAASLFAWALLGERFKDLRIESVDIAGIKATVGTLEKRVDSLSDQMKAFFASKIVEIFDEKNWSQVRTVKRGTDPRFILEVTLKQKPLPGSIEVFEGVLQMPEQMYRLNGRTLQFPANTNIPDEGITIKYYPDLTLPGSK
jgi:hypothetical protein